MTYICIYKQMKKQQHCFHTSLSDLQYHAFFLFPKTVIILRSVRHFSVWVYIIAKYIIFYDHQWNINIKHRIVSVKHQTVHPGWKNYLMLVCSISFNSVTHIQLKAQIQIKQNSFSAFIPFLEGRKGDFHIISVYQFYFT